MYRLYYRFDLISKYTDYFLLNDAAELKSLSAILFRHVILDFDYKLRVYKECDKTKPKKIGIKRDVSNCENVDYDKVLRLYYIIQIRSFNENTNNKDLHSELKSDLDLILLNWNVS
jgi:hypothetical protein